MEAHSVATEPRRADEIDTSFLDGVVGYWLRRASHVIATDYSARVKETAGLRSVQVSILAVVGANPGISQTQLGRSLGVQRANMVPLLASLIEDGLLRREPSDEDKRVLELYPTSAGEVKLHVAKALIDEHENALLAALTAQERRTVIQLLAKIADAGTE
ncbi:MAG TPA: MarR family transcriptional regulator [Rhizorhapis sp.]|nr:MarR family transcriptional regulator [Rhizorhapis sp.]